MNYVLSAVAYLLALCHSHPAATVMVVGAVVSCFYKSLDKYPRVHAFFEALAHMGVNVPGVAAALSRLLTGTAATAAAVVSAFAITFSIAATAGAIMVFATISACGPALAVTSLAKGYADCLADASSRAEDDSCRARVRAAFCTANPGQDSRCDAGVDAQTDAGASAQKDAAGE